MRRAWLALLLAAGPAAAEEVRLGLRVGEHPGRSRLVLDWPGRPDYRAEQQGDRLLLRLPPGTAPEAESLRQRMRQVQAMALTSEGLVLTLRPGARVRHFTMDHRLVLDFSAGEAEPAQPGREALRDAGPRAEVLRLPRPGRPPAAEPPRDAVDAAVRREQVAQAVLPPPGRERRTAALPEDAGLRGRDAAASRTSASLPAGPDGAALAAAAAASAVVTPSAGVATLAPEALPTPAAMPAAANPGPPPALAPAGAVAPRLLPRPGQPPALLLPFSQPTGAAILRRGDALLLAFASPQPLDLSALRAHPLFGPAEAIPLPGGSLLRLPLAAPAGIEARREGPGWVLQIGHGHERPEAEAHALAPEALEDTPPRFGLRANRPGPVLALTDPETGLPLLLGTVLEAGQAMPLPRRLAELDLPETLLGLAVLARADSVTLVSQQDRFLVAAAGGERLALDSAAATSAPRGRGLTRSFDLPQGGAAELLHRLRGQQAGIAAAAPLARAAVRHEAAETLLALGLGPEAQAMAGLAMAEDPAAAANPQFRVLAAAAALLAGRVAEARPLRDAPLADSDELRLWRAALAAAEQEPARAAAGFAATLPLLLDYPPPLRDRLLPLAAEAMGEAGDWATLSRLLAAVPAEALPLPRARLLEAEGKPAEALAAYRALGRGRDRRARAIALRRAIDLQLAAGTLDAPAAARALDTALFAWRGDAVDLAARRRLAELRLMAKQPQAALALLQETAQLFPEQAAGLQPPMVEALLAALREEPPLAAIALHDAHAELLQSDPRGEEAAVLLAERLVALDLPERAATLLARAADRAGDPARRAALGLRLAALKLEDGDAAAALAALEASRAELLPEALSRERVVLAARAEARRGNLAQAVQGLQALGEAGMAPLADLLAEAQDWPAAAVAGAQLVAALPAAPTMLDAAWQRLLLRQAALLVLAGDEAGLAALRAAHGERLGEGAAAAAFAALTAESLKGLADLPRLAREQQLFRQLPRRLEALRAGTPLTR